MLNGEGNENSKKNNNRSNQQNCRCFVRLQREISQLHVLWGKCPVFLFALFFFTAAHFHPGSRWHFSLPLYKNFHVFLPKKFVSFFLTLVLALFLLSTSVKTLKYKVEKQTRLCVFLRGHAIYRQYERVLEMRNFTLACMKWPVYRRPPPLKLPF